VSIDAEPGRLVTGTLDGVVVKGVAWQSPLNLSARLLEVQVGSSQVDIPRTLQTRNIQLRNVPSGAGRVRFTTEDFKNFLDHPLMQSATDTAVQGEQFRFISSTVSTVPMQQQNGQGAVWGLRFSGETWDETMRNGGLPSSNSFCVWGGVSSRELRHMQPCFAMHAF